MSNHIPAWKRLGLKLKYANDTVANQQDAESDLRQNKSLQSPPDATLSKRKAKHVAANGDDAEPASKKIRRDHREHMPDRSVQTQGNTGASVTPQKQLVRKKSVSFASDTKAEDGDSANTIPLDMPNSPGSTPKKPKRKDRASNAQQSVISHGEMPRKSRLALDYLDQHYRDRSAWKFNKSRDIWIMNHVLSTEDIPAAYNAALANYLHGLKSASTRERTIKSCRESLQGMKISTDKSLNNTSTDAEMTSKFCYGLKDDQLCALTGKSEDLATWVEAQKRQEVVLWALNEPTGPLTEDLFDKKMAPNTNGTPVSRVKKSKARTSRIEIETNTSSSGDSSSDESTSSSGSDSDTAISDSESSSASSDSTSSSGDSDSDE